MAARFYTQSQRSGAEDEFKAILSIMASSKPARNTENPILKHFGASKMAEWVEVLASSLDDMSSIPMMGGEDKLSCVVSDFHMPGVACITPLPHINK